MSESLGFLGTNTPAICSRRRRRRFSHVSFFFQLSTPRVFAAAVAALQEQWNCGGGHPLLLAARNREGEIGETRWGRAYSGLFSGTISERASVAPF